LLAERHDDTGLNAAAPETSAAGQA
jgi:hypothetical protein